MHDMMRTNEDSTRERVKFDQSSSCITACIAEMERDGGDTDCHVYMCVRVRQSSTAASVCADSVMSPSRGGCSVEVVDLSRVGS